TASALPDLDEPTAAELAALTEANDLSDDDRRRVLVGQRLVATGDPWAMLAVLRGCDKKVLKRAFFDRSKLFHPDRYYGRHFGSSANPRHHACVTPARRSGAARTTGTRCSRG